MIPKPVFSPATAAAFATTLIVLGIVGWSAGWLAASSELKGLGTGETPSPSTSRSAPASATPASPTPVTSRPTATATTLPPNAIEMPDLLGQKYLDARRAAFGLGLSVNVHFNRSEDEPAGTVVETNPRAGEYVLKGWTISIHVTGAVPQLEVPELIGLPCKKAKDRLIELGLTIGSYPSGEKGAVYKADPVAGTKLPWNSRVKLYCSESASPGTSSG